jgi:demethylmenaquinone methyltransferase/2-methoxy-6-polyprenyl-1,4-benzoquinol methylase
LQPHADEVLALDSSEQMLELARAKVSAPNVRFERADVFQWEPPDFFDVVFSSFWISHVPEESFAGFWELVGHCLGDEGRIFFIDERPHEHWNEEYLADELVQRTLRDGTRHRVIKRFWSEEELEMTMRKLGWTVTVTGSGPFFWAAGTRA